MNVQLENLEQIPKIITLLNEINSKLNNQVESKWLSVKQLIEYINYSKSTIYKKVTSNEFIQNVHYYRREGKLFFDKNEVDNWVKGINLTTNNYQNNDLLIDTLLMVS